MPGESTHPRIYRVLPIVTGAILIGAAFVADLIVGGPGIPQMWAFVFVVSGCSLVILAYTLRRRHLSAALAKVSLTILSAVISLALAELVFRTIQFDFNRTEALPIYFRPPTLEIGNGALRRSGPAVWRGKPLSEMVRIKWGSKNAYPNEQNVEIRYDDQGFRNPPELSDWEVVVTGDSFVELGFLPYDDLFTTIAARRLGLRIKNLGVSATGPAFQTTYVRKYGKAASTRDAVLCFFEGNDTADLQLEMRRTNSVHAPRFLEQPKQPSFIFWLCERFWRLRSTAHITTGPPTNSFLKIGPAEYAATIESFPPVWNAMAESERLLVAMAMTNWANTARTQGLRPWVMCIPDCHRLFHGRLRFLDSNSPPAQWTPGDFASHLATICRGLDVRFIDAAPALQGELDAGRVPYNLIGDTHFNVRGSHAIGELLAEALKRAVSEESPTNGPRNGANSSQGALRWY